MRDLDILVPEYMANKVAQVLLSLGYNPKVSWNWTDHAYVCRRPGAPVTIDVHRRLGPQTHIVTAENVQNDAMRITYGGLKFGIPSPTHRAFHNIFHAAEQDRNYVQGLFPLM